MYLIRLTLDPRSTQARRDLADAYDMHRTLVRAFVRDERDAPGRFLWRLELGAGAWASPTLLVQSRKSGDWDVLQGLPGYLQRPAECKVLDLEALIQPQWRYRFRLLANPTVTRAGKRRGLLGEAEQLAWLQRQGERHGFMVKAVLVSASDLLDSRRKGGAPIVLQRVCFEGLLQVVEADALRRALASGIGPAKAFGCGLLSVARC
ncbi:type I-E CRISPR-associated protein Cas6/Cse3/CasE [Azorhizophilus paspali]|uniref:Type I-E CRISPR-associated protein Cas6/Cse3/CasE n=1 Tax=Azorhizophilus paspali TaxID=69963 RepID=A0ABV6SHD2_AZOPA